MADLWVLHILVVNLFNFDAVVLKFTISKNKLLKLCNYRGNVRSPGVKTFNKTSPSTSSNPQYVFVGQL